jgi:hypothetical protein
MIAVVGRFLDKRRIRFVLFVLFPKRKVGARRRSVVADELVVLLKSTKLLILTTVVALVPGGSVAALCVSALKVLVRAPASSASGE